MDSSLPDPRAAEEVSAQQDWVGEEAGSGSTKVQPRSRGTPTDYVRQVFTLLLQKAPPRGP